MEGLRSHTRSVEIAYEKNDEKILTKVYFPHTTDVRDLHGSQTTLVLVHPAYAWVMWQIHVVFHGSVNVTFLYCS